MTLYHQSMLYLVECMITVGNIVLRSTSFQIYKIKYCLPPFHSLQFLELYVSYNNNNNNNNNNNKAKCYLYPLLLYLYLQFLATFFQ
jgi:hypothetical protein